MKITRLCTGRYNYSHFVDIEIPFEPKGLLGEFSRPTSANAGRECHGKRIPDPGHWQETLATDLYNAGMIRTGHCGISVFKTG